jgi:2-iminobutanoate/2-iminopropanoate deaminase
MPELKIVHTDQAPAAIGPYCQAIVHGGLVFTAGQIALDPATGEMSDGDIAEQTDRVLRSLSAVLASAGASLQTVIKTTVFMRDLGEFAAMNVVYARYFADHNPGRSPVQVARLPRDAAVEIELVAAVK